MYIYIYINYIFKDYIYIYSMYIFVCKYFFSMYYTNDDNIYIYNELHKYYIF